METYPYTSGNKACPCKIFQLGLNEASLIYLTGVKDLASLPCTITMHCKACKCNEPKFKP